MTRQWHIQADQDNMPLELLKLEVRALKAFPSSPRQLAIRKQIEALQAKMEALGIAPYHPNR